MDFHYSTPPFLHFFSFSGLFCPFSSILATLQPRNQVYPHQDTLGTSHTQIGLGDYSWSDTRIPLHSAKIIFENGEKRKFSAKKKLKNGGNSKFSAWMVEALFPNPLGSTWIFHTYIWTEDINHLINEATSSDLILIFFLSQIPFFPAILGF